MFKHLLRFVRDHKDGLVEVLLKAKFDGAAAVIRKSKQYAFKNWRWGTIHDCSKAIDFIMDTLQSCHIVIAGYINRCKDRVQATAAYQAIVSKDFNDQRKFVHYIGETITRLQNWGGSCICHAQEFAENRPVVDVQKLSVSICLSNRHDAHATMKHIAIQESIVYVYIYI
jgi:hypothetical protein